MSSLAKGFEFLGTPSNSELNKKDTLVDEEGVLTVSRAKVVD